MVSSALLGIAVLLMRRRGADAGIRWALTAGGCAGVAAVAFQLSAQADDLSVVAAVTSLYPAVTVIAAAAVARSWWSRREGGGLVLAVAALVMIAS